MTSKTNTTSAAANVERFYRDVERIGQCLRTGRWDKLPNAVYRLHIRTHDGAFIKITHPLPIADLTGELHSIHQDGEIIDAIAQ